MQPLAERDKAKSPFTPITTSSLQRVLSLQHRLPSRQKNDLFSDVEFYCFCCIITTRTINRCCVHIEDIIEAVFKCVTVR